ncbi:hypothetical protein [Cohnella sp. WQ 127256]|uniref:hypothetical protein n=1 Tax=Cohnella sp. WQ 127256 TaxID=2938790 RepID=UPI0021195C98|nr:hypothetical protein [Cohnella sp. WQ 127256]
MRNLLIGLCIILMMTGCVNNTTTEKTKNEVEISTEDNEIKEEPSNTNTTVEENDLINLFRGVWTNKEQQDISLELQDGIELIGVKEGQLMTSAEYTISEVNTQEQSIVIEGYIEDISNDEKTEKREYSSKLYLKNEGKELLYIFDYLNEKHESEWIK